MKRGPADASGELARGVDVYGLTPTGQMSENEIEAARSVQYDRLNVQNQQRFTWTPSFAVVRSFVDQLVRADAIDAKTLAKVNKFVDRAERFRENGQADAARSQLLALAEQLEGNSKYDALVEALRDLADA